jgi:hypothetical protein
MPPDSFFCPFCGIPEAGGIPGDRGGPAGESPPMEEVPPLVQSEAYAPEIAEKKKKEKVAALLVLLIIGVFIILWAILSYLKDLHPLIILLLVLVFVYVPYHLLIGYGESLGITR